MISACGVKCSDCPAFHAAAKGASFQQQVADAWQRIYAVSEPAGHISCGGCLGPDDEIFYTSRSCIARQCSRSKGYKSCAECPVNNCPDLDKAQSSWDEVPLLIGKLSPSDFDTYAKPYCDHRKRVEEMRTGFVQNT